MLVLGHRGSVVPGPENTAAAVAAALAAGADGVEIDLRRTSDGRLVLSHDPTRAGVVLAQTPYDPALGAPLFTDVVGAHAEGRFVLEVKNIPGEPDFDAPHEATARLLLPLLRGVLAQRPGEVVVSAFDWFALELVRDELDGAVPTAFLVPPGVAVDAALGYAGPARHHEVHVPVAALLAMPDHPAPEDPATEVARCHDAGLRVVAWTVATDEQALRLRDLGVDGVIVDDPVSVLAALA